MTKTESRFGTGEQAKNPTRAIAVNRVRLITATALLAGAVVATSVLAEESIACRQEKGSAAADVGGVWWSELVTTDPVRSRNFYEKVVGWSPKIVSSEDNSRPPKAGEEDYTLFMQNRQEVAGLVKMDKSQDGVQRAGWFTYIQVASVDDAVTAALKNGGKVLKFPVDVPKVGRIAIVEDPQGLPVGLVTPTLKTSG